MCIRDSLKPDVLLLKLLLNETHLTPANRLRLANYVCYRNERPGTAGGGTAVAVRLSLDHHRVVLPATTHLEVTAVEILNTLGGVLLVAAYKPPQKELLHPDLAVAFDAHRRVIMAGDLKCKHRDWNSRLTAPNGKRLRRFADSRRVTVIGPCLLYTSRCV